MILLSKWRRLLSTTLVVLTLGNLSSQAQIATYTTMQNELMVWDRSMVRKIDYLRPVSVKAGRAGLAFIDNSRNFKIYYDGGVKEINRGFTNNYQVTDNLITYQNATSLYVWEKGNITLLTKSFGEFYTADSVVVYFDDLKRTYNAYYQNRTYELEGFLAGVNRGSVFNTDENITLTSRDIQVSQFSQLKVGDNIVAYVNYANQFKSFYKGMIWDLEDYGVESFGVGRNITAFVDYNNHFRVFYKGLDKIIDNFVPESYKVGDDLVAYMSVDNRFKIFYNDSVYDIGNFQPDYSVADNIVYFRNARGYFTVFYKGKLYELEAFVPNEVFASYNSLVYVNRNNMLRMFSAGKTYDVVTADVPWWELNYDVLVYRFGSNMFKVFYEGDTY